MFPDSSINIFQRVSQPRTTRNKWKISFNFNLNSVSNWNVWAGAIEHVCKGLPYGGGEPATPSKTCRTCRLSGHRSLFGLARINCAMLCWFGFISCFATTWNHKSTPLSSRTSKGFYFPPSARCQVLFEIVSYTTCVTPHLFFPIQLDWNILKSFNQIYLHIYILFIGEIYSMHCIFKDTIPF